MYNVIAAICLGVVLNLMGYSVVDAAGTLNLNNLIIYLLFVAIYFLNNASIFHGFIKRVEQLEAAKAEETE